MPFKKPTLGRGSNMSLAKAALVVYYEYFYDPKFPTNGLLYGDLDLMHEIVTVAGAKHCSWFTASQVSSCLAQSPYWNKECIRGMYRGMRGNGNANNYHPSEKGKRYYEQHYMGKDIYANTDFK